uniref:Uncharacterized protein n=1 Tax=Borely moumouvirus TaxID=2712067 RepID=A0A6G6AAC9_9VIRU
MIHAIIGGVVGASVCNIISHYEYNGGSYTHYTPGDLLTVIGLVIGTSVGIGIDAALLATGSYLWFLPK